MTGIFSLDGALAKCLDTYEPRVSQQIMADEVTSLINGEGHNSPGCQARLLVVEAETGIGKTLGYLIPAILAERRIVISTATLNLQDQIMDKEVPLIERVLGRKVSALCVKGRENYLCRYRWYQYRCSAEGTLIDDPQLDLIEQWLATTTSGDRAELDWLPDRSELWRKISAKPNQCLGSECPESADCFVNMLRKRAGSATVLVVNHHLFFSDLMVRQSGFGEVLPRYEGVIFDEAHHLENVATAFFGSTFSSYQLLDLFQDIERQAEQDLDPDRLQQVMGVVRGLKTRADDFTSIFPAERGKHPLSDLISRHGSSVWQAELELMTAGLKRLAEELQSLRRYGEGWATLGRRVEELSANLLTIGMPDEQSASPLSSVYWYERKERSVVLSATPIQVAHHLQTALYASVEWCVFTSATLSSAGDFSYLQDRLGLDEATRFICLPSPFAYRERTLIYVPENTFPEPSSAAYQQACCQRVLTLLESSKGRGLVLCTSFRAMDYLAEYLEERLDYPLLVQGRSSRSALLQMFQEQTESVLLAVASFWEGVDVPGESLSLVVIDKLPFEVPTDPVIQARIEEIAARGGKPFFDFQVPRAILSLRQGVGRLMRTADDRGVIAILDVRLYSKAYGRLFRQSLPPSPLVRELQPVTDFYHQSPTNTAGAGKKRQV